MAHLSNGGNSVAAKRAKRMQSNTKEHLNFFKKALFWTRSKDPTRQQREAPPQPTPHYFYHHNQHHHKHLQVKPIESNPIQHHAIMLFHDYHCPPSPNSPTRNPLPCIHVVLETGNAATPDLYNRCNDNDVAGEGTEHEHDDGHALKQDCDYDGIPSNTIDSECTPDGYCTPNRNRSRTTHTRTTHTRTTHTSTALTRKRQHEEIRSCGNENDTNHSMWTVNTYSENVNMVHGLDISSFCEADNAQNANATMTMTMTMTPNESDHSEDALANLAARVTPVPISECQWTELDMYSTDHDTSNDTSNDETDMNMTDGIDSTMTMGQCRYDHLFIPILQELTNDNGDTCSDASSSCGCSESDSDMSISVSSEDEESNSDMSMSSDDESVEQDDSDCISCGCAVSVRSLDSYFPSITECPSILDVRPLWHCLAQEEDCSVVPVPDVIRICMDESACTCNCADSIHMDFCCCDDEKDPTCATLSYDRSKYFKPISLIENDSLDRIDRMEFLLEQAKAIFQPNQLFQLAMR